MLDTKGYIAYQPYQKQQKEQTGLEKITPRQTTPARETPNPENLVEELPVALVYNGISIAVMMATPTHLTEFAIGFSISEQIVSHRDDIYDIQINPVAQGIEIALSISSQQFNRLKTTRRQLTGNSGCGLCGVDSIQYAMQTPPPVTGNYSVNASALFAAQQQFGTQQKLHQLTGGIHGAAWFNQHGELLYLFEDIGRHNALDKLIGTLMSTTSVAKTMTSKNIDSTNVKQGFVMMSSRISYELVRKAATANIGIIVGVSAVSSLAIQSALALNIAVYGFCRQQRFTQYTAGHG